MSGSGESTKSAKNWIPILISMGALAVSVLSFIDSRALVAAQREFDCETLLDEAWDIIGGDPGSDTIYVLESDRRQLTLAGRKIKQAEGLDPRSPRLLLVKGACFAARMEFEKAAGVFRSAIDLYPNQEWTHRCLALTLTADGKCEEAIEIYSNMHNYESWEALTHLNYGDALFECEKLDLAMIESRRAIEKDPSMAAAHCNLGEQLSKAGRVPEAIESLSEAARLDPSGQIGALASHLLAKLQE